jgi:hypothetical protein
MLLVALNALRLLLTYRQARHCCCQPLHTLLLQLLVGA